MRRVTRRIAATGPQSRLFTLDGHIVGSWSIPYRDRGPGRSGPIQDRRAAKLCGRWSVFAGFAPKGGLRFITGCVADRTSTVVFTPRRRRNFGRELGFFSVPIVPSTPPPFFFFYTHPPPPPPFWGTARSIFLSGLYELQIGVFLCVIMVAGSVRRRLAWNVLTVRERKGRTYVRASGKFATISQRTTTDDSFAPGRRQLGVEGCAPPGQSQSRPTLLLQQTARRTGENRSVQSIFPFNAPPVRLHILFRLSPVLPTIRRVCD
jgi:hypothetical protein